MRVGKNKKKPYIDRSQPASNGMITIYTLTYNEELLIQFMIDHYRIRFPGCRIVFFDNISTDNTVKIALANNCEVIPFDTGGQFQDRRHMEIKNSCWKDAKTDWVLVCDLDELLDINEAQLNKEEASSISIIRTECYDMINLEDNLDIAEMKYGVISELPGKFCLFNKKLMSEINYGPGCHTCSPVGIITYSKTVYKLYHYNSISENLTIKKFRLYRARLSPENLKNGWGIHYLMTPKQIREEFAAQQVKAIKVR